MEEAQLSTKFAGRFVQILYMNLPWKILWRRPLISAKAGGQSDHQNLPYSADFPDRILQALES
jgi:hypothetical protein